MYEIKEKEREIGGKTVTTYSRDIYSANVLEVEAGTNGYQGGDSGHGSRTYFRIENAGGTDIEAHFIGPYGTDGIEVTLGGDCELETIIMALKFITKALEDGAKEVYDSCSPYTILTSSAIPATVPIRIKRRLPTRRCLLPLSVEITFARSTATTIAAATTSSAATACR